MFHSIKWTVGTHVGASVDLSVEQLVQHILDRQQAKPQPRTHSCLCTTTLGWGGGEETPSRDDPEPSTDQRYNANIL
ncbi:hypothetical protein CRUP_022229 [Coryphaenoides rupestris]|nr:hypothetical protein CRUP_022229 [Coryphaenoides rupestris]